MIWYKKMNKQKPKKGSHRASLLHNLFSLLFISGSWLLYIVPINKSASCPYFSWIGHGPFPRKVDMREVRRVFYQTAQC